MAPDSVSAIANQHYEAWKARNQQTVDSINYSKQLSKKEQHDAQKRAESFTKLEVLTNKALETAKEVLSIRPITGPKPRTEPITLPKNAAPIPKPPQEPILYLPHGVMAIPNTPPSRLIGIA